MISNLQRNGASALTIAEQRQAAHNVPSVPEKPTRPARPTVRALLPWLAACGLSAAILGAAYALTPAVPSVAVRQVFVDVDGNGSLDLLLYGEVILNTGPLAGGE